jgi:Uma2 family endonuclease
MAYHDGTLEIMSPESLHEIPARRFGLFIYEVATGLGISCTGTRSTVFRLRGEDVKKGKGKEPDESFYFANEASILASPDRAIDLDAGDPPPDLWIEIDNRASSAGKLPIYAALGVPEVWRYRTRRRTLWFGRRVEDAYEAVERSLSLPMLTPALVLEALALGAGKSEIAWGADLRNWVRETLVPLVREEY